MLNKKRERRKKVVESLLKRIRNSGLPDKVTGRLLRGLHFHLYLLVIIGNTFTIEDCYNNNNNRILVNVAYVYYGGCVLTSVENELFKNVETERNVTIVDSIILFCKDELNGKTRNKYTIAGFSVWITTVILIY